MQKQLSLQQKLQVVNEAAETRIVKNRREIECVFSQDSQTVKKLSNVKPGASMCSIKLTLHLGATAQPIEPGTQLYD